MALDRERPTCIEHRALAWEGIFFWEQLKLYWLELTDRSGVGQVDLMGERSTEADTLVVGVAQCGICVLRIKGALANELDEFV